MFAQILAVAIFVTMFVLIIMDKIERHYITLMCGFATYSDLESESLEEAAQKL